MKIRSNCILIPIMSSLLLICSCSNAELKKEETKTIPKLNVEENSPNLLKPNIQVKGLTLKYELISSAFEMYMINILKVNHRNENSYKNGNSYEHYLWLINTYKSFNDEMKDSLKQIYSEIHASYYMNILTKLEDKATLNEILSEIQKDRYINNNIKAACGKFFPYFYESYFKEYFAKKANEFDNSTSEINKVIEENNPNIIDFMERNSGIKFNVQYKSEFYYFLDPISAYGFNNNDKKISTIGPNCNNYKDLFRAPFHEYSHELFQTFTRNSEQSLQVWRMI